MKITGKQSHEIRIAEKRVEAAAEMIQFIQTGTPAYKLALEVYGKCYAEFLNAISSTTR